MTVGEVLTWKIYFWICFCSYFNNSIVFRYSSCGFYLSGWWQSKPVSASASPKLFYSIKINSYWRRDLHLSLFVVPLQTICFNICFWTTGLSPSILTNYISGYFAAIKSRSMEKSPWCEDPCVYTTCILKCLFELGLDLWTECTFVVEAP